jgi:hypothetical protein
MMAFDEDLDARITTAVKPSGATRKKIFGSSR